MTLHNNNAYVVMDVGGTFIKSGIMSAEGLLIEGSQRTVPIDSDGSKEEIINSLTDAVRQGISLAEHYGYDAAGIGICMPGPFNYYTGVSAMEHKFAAIKDLPLKELISESLEGSDIPIVFGHDVNTQLYGEMCGGNARGFGNACLISIGTGLGMATAVDGKILMTPAGSPLKSIWFLPYKDGILEDYVSKRGFYRLWEETAGVRPSEAEMTVADMGRMAIEGNPTAVEVFRRAGELIGSHIREHLLEYRTGCLLFGGQISRSFDFMEAAVRKELADIEGLEIRTVSDFSNAAFKGLAEMLNA